MRIWAETEESPATVRRLSWTSPSRSMWHTSEGQNSRATGGMEERSKRPTQLESDPLA